MAPKSIFPMMTLVLNFLTLPSASGAELPGSVASNLNAFRTDRLSPAYLRVWKTIESYALAKDKAGRILYPKLHSLWQRAQGSGNVIHVEISDKDPQNPTHAGRFAIETDSPDGQTRAVTISLFLSVIDKTVVPRETRGRDFVRFRGLGRNKRYAEVAGHELAHAFSILNDGRLASAYRELERLGKKAIGAYPYDSETLQNLAHRQILSAEIEKPAVVAEAEIWHELLRENPNEVRP